MKCCGCFVGGNGKTRTRWGCTYQKKNSQTRGYRKIPFTLLPMLQFPSGLVSKPGRLEVLFPSRSRKYLYFDKSMPIPKGGGRFNLALKFRSWLVALSVTNWLTIFENPQVSDRLSLPQREFSWLLSITPLSIRDNDNERHSLHYANRVTLTNILF